MLGKLEKVPQLDIFRIPLKHTVPDDDQLIRLSHQIQWDKIVSSLSVYYSPNKGRRAIPIRKLSGILILKKIYGGSDESILRAYVRNPDFQYFCGEIYPQNRPLCSRSDLVKFRSRIGKSGMEGIFYPELTDLINQIREKATNQDNIWNFRQFFRALFYLRGSVG